MVLSLSMPPPSPEEAVFTEIVESATYMVFPMLKIPPPEPELAELLFIVEFVTVMVAPVL
jgi:hypothetical protein